jgi:tetratricopeptide (TPR) repeat protein
MIVEVENTLASLETSRGFYLQALERRQRVLAQYDWALQNAAEVAVLEKGIAFALARLGRVADGLAMAARAEARIEEADQASRAEKFLVWNATGDVHFVAGRLSSAEDRFRKAQELVQSVRQSHVLEKNLLSLYLHAGRLEDASSIAETRRRRLAEIQADDREQDLGLQLVLAKLHYAKGEFERAAALAGDVLKSLGEPLRKGDPIPDRQARRSHAGNRIDAHALIAACLSDPIVRKRFTGTSSEDHLEESKPLEEFAPYSALQCDFIAAEIWIRADDRDRAVEALAALEERVRQWLPPEDWNDPKNEHMMRLQELRAAVGKPMSDSRQATR